MVYDEQEPARSPRRLTAVPPAPAPVVVAAPAGRAAGRRTGRTYARDLAETILLTLVIFLAVRGLVVNFRVDGNSMQPTLDNGAYLLVNRAVYFHLDLNRLRRLLPGEDADRQDRAYLGRPPAQGDVVVFSPPDSPDTPFVKRVIALPGETVAVRGGRVYVDGRPIAEPYVAEPARYLYPREGRDLVVPDGMVFVLGDNRNSSRDSHAFGPISLDSVIGQAVVAYWPPDSVGRIPHQPYARADDR